MWLQKQVYDGRSPEVQDSPNACRVRTPRVHDEARAHRRRLNASCLSQYSDSEEETEQGVSHYADCYSLTKSFFLASAMPLPWPRVLRWRTNIMLLCIISLAAYIIFFDPSAQGKIPNEVIDYEEIEEQLENGHPVRLVTYKSPLDESLFTLPFSNHSGYAAVYKLPGSRANSIKFHKIWLWADEAISKKELFPESAHVDSVVAALAQAPLVHVDVLDIGVYESGTSEKWVVTLAGGQKAMMKLIWEEKGVMKKGALCNYGFEIPSSEIAAFHLHRILGFRNTPYVTGRKVNLLKEVLPVASPSVARQIQVKAGNQTCVVGKCFYCTRKHTMCPTDGVVEASLVYWVHRKLKLWTYPPKYMPFSTPRMDEWGKIPLNNHTYCKKIHSIEPYNHRRYYYDLFDFAVVDTLMYHYDSKHYTINDESDAKGATVRLDHGRSFCASDRDEEHVFLAPITQCCTLRKSTWEALEQFHGSDLSERLRESLSSDPVAPVLADVWYPALDRRLALIKSTVRQCVQAKGGWDKVLV